MKKVKQLSKPDCGAGHRFQPRSHFSIVLLRFLYINLLLVAQSAQSAQAAEPEFSFFGDLRGRFESDWDSQRRDGSYRDDRARLRTRVRVGLDISAGESLDFRLRARSGSRSSQQSPHITLADFDHNATGDKHLVLDNWFVSYQGDEHSFNLGRMGLPFWKQNELFWDDDVTVLGIAYSNSRKTGSAELRFSGGLFKLPDGQQDFHGEMQAAQFVYRAAISSLTMTAAGGLSVINGSPGARFLRGGTGDRDYHIWHGSVQLAAEQSLLFLPPSLSLGLDMTYNSKGRRESDPIWMEGQNTSYVVSLVSGRLNAKNNFVFGAYYAYIEALAVNASYAQDDWLRWGSATQTDASDFKGAELRLGYAISDRLNLLARFYSVRSMSSSQDGKRFRIDLNYRF